VVTLPDKQLQYALTWYGLPAGAEDAPRRRPAMVPPCAKTHGESVTYVSNKRGKSCGARAVAQRCLTIAGQYET